ncbi:MAG: hypothetical protein ACTSSF_02600 [Candidatus Heimdallarchaeaceae archaeon]
MVSNLILFWKGVKKAYSLFKKWFIVVNIIFLVIYLYAGDLLGPWAEKLFYAAVIAILSILLEVLLSIGAEMKLDIRVEIFPNFSAAIPIIQSIISKQKTIDIKIIAQTGASHLSLFLKAISSNPKLKKEKITITMGILSPELCRNKHLPNHWLKEVETSIYTIKEKFKGTKIDLKLVLFNLLPSPSGVLINNKHLIFTILNWIQTKESQYELAAAENPHYYYKRRTPENEYFYCLFESWLTNCPSDLITIEN